MSLYKLLDNVKEILIEDKLCNSVTSGDLSEAMLNKKILYPYSHVSLGTSSFPANTIQYNLFVLCMDIVDVSKDSITDQYKGNDNEHDAFNTTVTILARLVEKFRSGDVKLDGYHLVGTPTAEPYYDQFTDKVAGWMLSLSVETINEVGSC
tara:strand:- start:283 stop:735 length:453 start_codon:yes stop_codon:yes gene_type:complete